MSFLGRMLLNTALPLELMAACLLFMLPVAHRPRFALRVAVGVPLAMLLVQAGFLLADWNGLLMQQEAALVSVSVFYGIIYSFVTYLLSVGFVFFCTRLGFSGSLYCATVAYLVQHLGYSGYTLLTLDSRYVRLDVYWPLHILLCGGIYLAAYWLVARRLPTHGYFELQVSHSLGITLGVLAMALLLSAFAQTLGQASPPMYRLYLIYDMACCSYVLASQLSLQKRLNLQKNLLVQQQLWDQQRAQYQLAQQNTEVINQKCHDLKHQIAALKLISDQNQRDASIRTLEESVMIYDSIVETGNQVLDSVLTEKSLLCTARGIDLSYIADGSSLQGMDAVDIYTLIGNALDNAIEGCSGLSDAGKKTIAFTLFSRMDMIFLQVENYYEGVIQFEGGLPRTTKERKDSHGYGMRSIRQIAEKYGGVLHLETENQIFLLQVTMPAMSG